MPMRVVRFAGMVALVRMAVRWENSFSCRSSATSIDATFSDEGDPAPPVGECSDVPPAVSGTITAAGSLSDFDGDAANGDWVLTVVDDEADDDGTLNEWCVLISAE